MKNLSTIRPEMNLDHMSEESRYNKVNIVAKWRVPINGKIYCIELDHGTTSGRRMIWVNRKEIIRREWMFKLVGEDSFYIDHLQCIIRVDPAPSFKYKYSLFIDGKSYHQYTEDQSKVFRSWVTKIAGLEYCVVLELNSFNVYLNDKLRSETGEFVAGGTDMCFMENEIEFKLQVRSSGNRREGMVYTLFVNQLPVDEADVQSLLAGEFNQ